jgi:uncharacterized peroxidase-related enzyme
MTRIAPLDPQTAQGTAKTLMDGVQASLGRVPNLMRVMAQAPAVLRGYLNLSEALGGGELPATAREQVALAVSEINGCDYCLAAHSTIGKMVGLSPDQIDAARRSNATDPKVDAALKLARAIVTRRGLVTDEEVTAARTAGLTDAEQLEVVGNVVLTILTNYVNFSAGTAVDFPRAAPLAAPRAA